MARIEFPNPLLADPEGLLAGGGDLAPDTLITAYSQGIFPWFNPGQPILWWSPDPRLVLYPERFKCSRSLRRVIKSATHQVTANREFTQVVRACATRGLSAALTLDTASIASLDTTERSGEPATWITADMQSAYQTLHTMGVAHSVEVWENGRLTGGLYGLKLGNAFFGESMFSIASNASKVALAYLVCWAKRVGVVLIDCQVTSPHLLSLGAIEVDRGVFLAQVKEHINDPSPEEKIVFQNEFAKMQAVDVIKNV